MRQELRFHSVAVGHIGCPQFRDIISKAATDIKSSTGIYFLSLLGKHLEVELLSHGRNTFSYIRK